MTIASDPQLEGLVAPLRRAKLVALLLLIGAAIVFISVQIAESRGATSSVLGYVGAAAEAAMVGALADWFAVTAMFRHPLGLPIPHTAIVPRRKNDIGQALGGFVQTNFMQPDSLAERVVSAQPAVSLGRWLQTSGNDDRVAEQVCRALDAVASVLDADEMAEHLEHALVDAVRSIGTGPVVAEILKAALADGRRTQVIDAGLGAVVRVLEANRNALRTGFAQRSPWWVPGSIDERVFEKLYTGILDLLGEVKRNPVHELRSELERNIDVFLNRLKTDPTTATQLAALRDEALHDPRVRTWLASAWTDARTTISTQAGDPESRLRSSIAAIVRRGSQTLINDPALRDRVDAWVAEFVRSLSKEHGHEIARLISSTVEKWDAQDTSRRIELQIGRDLQFIRINGTIVGGVVGVLIHAVSELIG